PDRLVHPATASALLPHPPLHHRRQRVELIRNVPGETRERTRDKMIAVEVVRRGAALFPPRVITRLTTSPASILARVRSRVSPGTFLMSSTRCRRCWSGGW